MSTTLTVQEDSDLFEIEAAAEIEDQLIIETVTKGIQEEDFHQSIISLTLEQCSICSAHYEVPCNTFLQPDLNVICKLLDISFHGQSVPNLPSHYVPVCTDCVKKIRRFDKLHLEMEILRHSIASSVVETLVHIRPFDSSPLHSLKNQILAKWMTRNAKGDIVVNSTPAPLHVLSHSSRKGIVKATVMPKSSFSNLIKLRSTENQLHEISKLHTVTLPTKLRMPTVKNIGGNSWIADDVSIVAESESEAQEILAAYISGNIIQAEVREDESEEDFTNLFSDADADTHVTISVINSDDVDVPQEASNKPKSHVLKKKRTKIKTKVKSAKRKVMFQRIPQHQKPPFFCEKCGRVYSKLTTFRIHAKSCEEQPTTKTVIPCPVCKITFSAWLDLKFHFDESHPNSPMDKCRFCKKDFLPNTMEGHSCVRNLSNETPVLRTFTCDYCENMYYKYTSLTEHVRRSHPDEKKFECSICHKQFVSKTAMENHEKVHTIIPEGKRSSHRCSVCGIACTTAWGLREHTKLHTGVRPYSCELCGKTFRLQNIKRNHMVVHTKERNFSCDICGRKYSLYATMYRHWKKCRLPSSPKKGRWCPICLSNGISFLKLTSLKDHMFKKHPGTKEQFEICKEPGNREFGFEASSDACSPKKYQKRTVRGQMILKDVKVFSNNERPDKDYFQKGDDPTSTPKVMRTESQRPPETCKKSDDGILRRSSRQRRTNSRLTSLTLQTHDPDLHNLNLSNYNKLMKPEEKNEWKDEAIDI